MKLPVLFSKIMPGVVLFLTIGLLAANPKPANAQEGVPVACIANGLTRYMNAVINGTRDLDRIRLLSPAWNLPNPAEAQIADIMLQGGALFSQLWGYSGNTYTVGGTRALQHFIDQNWPTRLRGKPWVFTEFGDFRLGAHPIGSRAREETLIPEMRMEFVNTVTSPYNIVGVNYFNAFGGNLEFAWNRLTDQELIDLTSGYEDRAGVNSALMMDSGAFQQRVSDVGLTWTVEIIERGDAETQRIILNSVNNYPQNEVVVRLCVMQSCGFQNPQTLVTFLRALNAGLQKHVYVIAGPNEPATERWATPDCMDDDIGDQEYDWWWLPPPAPPRPEPPPPPPLVPCNEEISPEFHSLRPYPASPCDTKQKNYTNMCAHEFIAREAFSVLPSNALNYNPATGICDAVSDFEMRCDYVVESEMAVMVYPAWSRLPIMGNTELVPNSRSADNRLSNPVRMMEYASWYLNGVTSRAEEEDEVVRNFNPQNQEHVERIFEVVNFSGPIKKLLPFNVQNGHHMMAILDAIELYGGLRQNQQDDAARSRSSGPNEPNIRHNQIVVCAMTANRSPVVCYNNNVPGPQTGFRIVDNKPWRWAPNKGLQYDPLFSFIPFSSTEDLVGGGDYYIRESRGSNNAIITLTDTTGMQAANYQLFLPHMEEVAQLANILQKTYVSSLFFEPQTGDATRIVRVGHADTIDIDAQLAMLNETPFCELLDSRENPGDLVYGVIEGRGEDDVGSPARYAGFTYEAEFSCTFPIPGEPNPECVFLCMEQVADGIPNTPETCRVDCMPLPEPCIQFAEFRMPVTNSTPEARTVWDKLVFGAYSVFRRMFPRVQDGAPVDYIFDIPAETETWYEALNVNFSGNVEHIGTGALAGDPLLRRTGDRARMFFPHIGSVHEYFLQNIQKALRPYGLGQAILPPPEDPEACVPLESLQELIALLPDENASCVGYCNNFGSNIRDGLGPDGSAIRRIFNSAASSYNVPVNMLVAVFFSEGGFNPGKYDLSDEAVLAASGPRCRIPNCENTESRRGALGPWQFILSTWNTMSDAATLAGIERNDPDRCNFIDSTFAAARTLSIGRGGAESYLSPYDAFPYCARNVRRIDTDTQGVPYNMARGASTSCAWSPSDIVTAGRQYLGYCEDTEIEREAQLFKPSPGCLDFPSTCYQTRILDLATCGEYFQ